MVAISRVTGKVIQDEGSVPASLLVGIQNLEVILSTPVKTRWFNRLFGSRLHELQDKNVDDLFELLVTSETTIAIEKFDPNFIVRYVSLDKERALEGEVIVDIHVFYVPLNRYVTIENVRLF